MTKSKLKLLDFLKKIWKLGQSKPNIEKLKEISSLYKVSIEQLTDDNNTKSNMDDQMEEMMD